MKGWRIKGQVSDEVASFDRLEVTLPDVYSWTSQVCQYADAVPPKSLPGFTYYSGEIPGLHPVDCLLWWDATSAGKPMIVGILNHYPVDYTLEKAGNVNLWVRRSHQRRGIGTALYRMADAMFGPLNPDQQRYTQQGKALMESVLARPARSRTSHPKG